MDFNGYTIYLVYIKKQAKITKIKDLCIYKDSKWKDTIYLSIYKDISIFESFSIDDNNKKELKNIMTPALAPILLPILVQMVIPVPILVPASVLTLVSIPVSALAQTVTTFQAGYTVRPTIKAKESFWTKLLPKSMKTRVLIIKLI